MQNQPIAHQTGRLIALGRLSLALLLLGFALTDFGRVGFRPEPDDYLAMAYAGFAIVAVLVAWRSWWWDFRLSAVNCVIDGATFIALLLAVPAFGQGFEVPVVGCAAFIEIALALRWNARASVVAAVIINCLWIIHAAYVLTNDPGAEIGLVFRGVLIVAIASLVVALTCMYITAAAVHRFEPQGSAEAPTLLAEMLDYAMLAAGAKGGAAIWHNLRATGQTLGLAGTLGSGTVSLEASVIDRSASPAPLAILFDLDKGHTLAMRASGLMADFRMTEFENELIRMVGIRSGICAPIEGIDASDWLVLTGIPGMSWGHLPLVAALSMEISRGTNRQRAFALSREAALHELRRSIARDLHDSVAQSLAGTKFWLHALHDKIRSGNDPLAEIDYVRRALETEHGNVRRLIAQLRQADPSRGTGDLIADMEKLIPSLESQWGAEIRLERNSGRLGVPSVLSFDIQQLSREAVANSVRHGGATTVEIDCRSDGQTLALSFKDNGAGFPADEAAGTPRTITERIAAMGGTLQVDSVPGCTNLRIRIPLEDGL